MGNQRRRRAGGPGRGSGAIGGAVHRNRVVGVQRLFLRPPGVATSLGGFGRRSRLLPPGQPARDRQAICGRSPAGPAPCAVRADWARPVGAGAAGPARGPARSRSLRRGWGLPRARGPEGRCGPLPEARRGPRSAREAGKCGSTRGAGPGRPLGRRGRKRRGKKSFLFSALYAAFIFGGRHLMNKRAKFELRKPLVLWSLTLAVFSIFGALRTGAYMVYILMTKGLKHSVCDQGFYNGPVSKFWAYAFVLSKAPELGDTIFIILRKQKLIFLHWYHHITVLLYSWYSYKDMVAGGGWFMTMNYGVHSVMYSYYALRAAGFRVSRKFAMFITLSQITQMLMGCVVNYLVFHWMQHDQCHSHFQNIFWSSLMYLSYLVLFCHFFFEAYIGKMRKTTKAD
ncbi:very long chain fatty acid elongase 6 isoform X1 [Delphinus delphis]|nr:elongation of very long chain fatty acids protein 6 isoform X1 [Delphinus delphis]